MRLCVSAFSWLILYVTWGTIVGIGGSAGVRGGGILSGRKWAGVPLSGIVTVLVGVDVVVSGALGDFTVYICVMLVLVSFAGMSKFYVNYRMYFSI